MAAFEHKMKFDGITRVVHPHTFRYDAAYGEGHTNRHVFDGVLQPHVAALLQGRLQTVTAFAYVVCVCGGGHVGV